MPRARDFAPSTVGTFGTQAGLLTLLDSSFTTNHPGRKYTMSEIQSETFPMRCTTPHCTCEIPKGTGFHKGEETYCNEQCADPTIRGCGQEGCACNKVD